MKTSKKSGEINEYSSLLYFTLLSSSFLCGFTGTVLLLLLGLIIPKPSKSIPKPSKVIHLLFRFL